MNYDYKKNKQHYYYDHKADVMKTLRETRENARLAKF